MKLRVGKCMVSTEVNGPGKRFVIWLQGCRFGCKGCYNPEFWDESGGTLMSVDDIMAQINSTDGIKGVAFTGGEPLLQSEALLQLVDQIKSSELTIVCYTGYLMSNILNDEIPYAKEFIEKIDILIDGLFNEQEKAPLLWRGSRNQRIHFLSERYKHLESLVLKEGTREVEIQIGSEGMNITGFFEMEMWNKLKEKMNKKHLI